MRKSIVLAALLPLLAARSRAVEPGSPAGTRGGPGVVPAAADGNPNDMECAPFACAASLRRLESGGLVLFGTALFGLIFLGFQAYEFTHFVGEGLTLQRNLFGSTFSYSGAPDIASRPAQFGMPESSWGYPRSSRPPCFRP